MKTSKTVRRLTVCAALSALGVVFLYIAAVMPTSRLGISAIAGLMPGVAVLVYGRVSGWTVYGITAVLALLLVPMRSVSVLYLLFLGHWPMVKSLLEKIPQGWLSFLAKLAVFNILLTVTIFLFSTLFFDLSGKEYATWLIYIIGNIAFIAYDFAFSLLVAGFGKRIREMLK